MKTRIPKAPADETRLRPDTQGEVSLDGSKTVVTPVVPEVTLEALLAGVTDENRHGAVETGPPVGNETL